MRTLMLLIFFISCDNFQQTEKVKKVARVNSSFLYLSDFENKISSELSYEDSLILSKSIINKWAIANLVYGKSLLHLHDTIQKKLTKMVCISNSGKIVSATKGC